ncbi:hypothetical protein QBC38DRAFT_160866 [Podospora fimiseda]|uniref:Uncharacterized protein n=1 Tax=Podospora fimiseda TaxID=252190 RepID=A0AAN6YR29_9PEZI|nr:hypothetical protein QBC38DRAFT_160866 [Podospora fimiseda]
MALATQTHDVCDDSTQPFSNRGSPISECDEDYLLPAYSKYKNINFVNRKVIIVWEDSNKQVQLFNNDNWRLDVVVDISKNQAFFRLYCKYFSKSKTESGHINIIISPEQIKTLRYEDKYPSLSYFKPPVFIAFDFCITGPLNIAIPESLPKPQTVDLINRLKAFAAVEEFGLYIIGFGTAAGKNTVDNQFKSIPAIISDPKRKWQKAAGSSNNNEWTGNAPSPPSYYYDGEQDFHSAAESFSHKRLRSDKPSSGNKPILEQVIERIEQLEKRMLEFSDRTPCRFDTEERENFHDTLNDKIEQLDYKWDSEIIGVRLELGGQVMDDTNQRVIEIAEGAYEDFCEGELPMLVQCEVKRQVEEAFVGIKKEMEKEMNRMKKEMEKEMESITRRLLAQMARSMMAAAGGSNEEGGYGNQGAKKAQ